MENNQEIIRLENVSKTFDLRYHKTLRAVDNVSLSLHKGICTAIVGESGCGKSTLMRRLAKEMLESKEAYVLVCDVDPNTPSI